MSEFGAYDFVTLVDRTGLGNDEIVYDSKRIVFKKDQIERPVPRLLAEWLFRVDQKKVHTIDGDYVFRYGIKDAPDDLVANLGEEVTDCSPITVDTSRLEGWDTDSYATERGDSRTVQLKRNPSDYANVATPGTTFGKER